MRKTKLFVNDAPVGIGVEMARALLPRMRGLLGRESCEGGMLLDPCQSIHTFFMRFRIDAVFLDEADRVIRVVPGIGPWRILPPVLSARRVLELPAGKLQLKPGDTLTFIE